MTGMHKYSTVASIVSIVINIFFGFLLSSYVGIYGVAISSTLGLIVWNIILSYVCIFKVGVNPTIFRFLDKFLKE